MIEMSRADIGIIGGSGLYEMEGLEAAAEVAVETPFGTPSDSFVLGALEGKRVAFLARHARGHRVLPHELNFRANLWAMKSLGVQWILSVSAVGSLKEKYAPLQMLIPDQFVDRTLTRAQTFFGRGLVAHVAFAHPFCKHLTRVMSEACRDAGATCHVGGSYVCIEGPQFSTRAESELYRSWGMDVVGMTNLQEARLAREAEICYVTLAMITDYDCWHDEEEAVSVDAVLAALRRNAAMAQEVVRGALRALPDAPGCGCRRALASALITDPAQVPAATHRRLALLVDKYLGPAAASP